MTKNFSDYEPKPIPNRNPSVHDLVIADIADRKTMGSAKYGTTLQAHNGRDALIDAYQEALDLACYLRQAIAERGGSDKNFIRFQRENQGFGQQTTKNFSVLGDK